jgi:hypothetical protein
LFLNGADRVLALDAASKVVRDTGLIAGLNPGGGVSGPDGRYYVGLRSARTILSLAPDLKGAGEHALPAGILPFPRGFGFNAEDRLFLASGIGPNGEGDDAVVAFAPADRTRPDRLVAPDPDLSPFDLIVAPNGQRRRVQRASVRCARRRHDRPEYDPESGLLVRVFSTKGLAAFRKPRGLRFGLDGNLYCVPQDEVVAFDFTSGRCLSSSFRPSSDETDRSPRANCRPTIGFPMKSRKRGRFRACLSVGRNRRPGGPSSFLRESGDIPSTRSAEMAGQPSPPGLRRQSIPRRHKR